MNKIYRIVLVGPTGAGKSQFCNFLLNVLSNSKHKVSDSLNSCTTQPQSTIMERNDIKLELIDSPGNSDSNNNDEENLKVLVDYLRNKKELNQIFLVLSFEDRLSRDTRDYLKILSFIFTPKEFISNLMIIFTHYPINPDEDDKNKSIKIKLEIIDILKQICNYSIILTQIPIYFINTKIIKRNGNNSFIPESENTLLNLLSELKYRLLFNNSSKIDTSYLTFIPKKSDNSLKNKLNEIEILRQKYNNLVQTVFLITQVKTRKHNHGVVLLYTSYNWICDICKLSKCNNESRYHCSLCDFNICKYCIETNNKYPLYSFNNYGKNYERHKFPNHYHELLFCRSSRFRNYLNSWNCDLCKRLFRNEEWSFYCTFCDFDICSICAKNYID